MNEDLKRNPDKSLMYFQKVYVYITNTKKPWDKLTEKEKNDKKFRWYCSKWSFITKVPMTENAVKHHIKNCPELKETEDNILKNHKKVDKDWKNKAEFFHIYDAYPLRDEYDLKLLINTIGLRMLHFVRGE